MRLSLRSWPCCRPATRISIANFSSSNQDPQKAKNKTDQNFLASFLCFNPFHPRTRAEVGDQPVPVDVIVTQITAPLFLTRA